MRDDEPVQPDQPDRAPGSAPDGGARPSDDELAALPTSPVRRAPRFRAFVSAGVIVGFLVAVVVVLLGPETEADGAGPIAILAFVAIAFCLVGALGGAVTAVLLDRRARR